MRRRYFQVSVLDDTGRTDDAERAREVLRQRSPRLRAPGNVQPDRPTLWCGHSVDAIRVDHNGAEVCQECCRGN